MNSRSASPDSWCCAGAVCAAAGHVPGAQGAEDLGAGEPARGAGAANTCQRPMVLLWPYRAAGWVRGGTADLSQCPGAALEGRSGAPDGAHQEGRRAGDAEQAASAGGARVCYMGKHHEPEPQAGGAGGARV
eukprot:1157584-Pelagomonas_calceolata.AAC.1